MSPLSPFEKQNTEICHLSPEWESIGRSMERRDYFHLRARLMRAVHSRTGEAAWTASDINRQTKALSLSAHRH